MLPVNKLYSLSLSIIQVKDKNMEKERPKTIFWKHFRIYFKNNHPAYIVDEEGNLYVFHRMTHSKTSGGRKNVEIENPLLRGDNKSSYIVKKSEKDKKEDLVYLIWN